MPAATAIPRARPRRALDRARADGRQVEAQILAALRPLDETPRPDAARIRPSFAHRATRARNPSVPSMSSTPTTCPSITTTACPMSNGPSARQHLTPFRDVGGCGRVRFGAGQTALGHQQIGRGILDPDHAKSVTLENAANSGEEVIVAAAKGIPYVPDNAERAKIDPDFRKRRTHQRADEHHIATALGAQQLLGAADLAN